MAESKNASKSFNLGDALKGAKLTDELTARKTTGRTRKPSEFDAPLKDAHAAGKVLAFDVPTPAVEDVLKEARSAARYLGIRLVVGQSENGNGVTTLELKPENKRPRTPKTENK